MWFQCSDCIFASNSPREAEQHVEKTTHEVRPEAEAPVIKP